LGQKSRSKFSNKIKDLEEPVLLEVADQSLEVSGADLDGVHRDVPNKLRHDLGIVAPNRRDDGPLDSLHHLDGMVEVFGGGQGDLAVHLFLIHHHETIMALFSQKVKSQIL